MMHATLIAETQCFANAPVKLGNLLLAKVASSTVYNHGGVCIGWPFVLHSIARGVCKVNASMNRCGLESRLRSSIRGSVPRVREIFESATANDLRTDDASRRLRQCDSDDVRLDESRADSDLASELETRLQR